MSEKLFVLKFKGILMVFIFMIIFFSVFFAIRSMNSSYALNNGKCINMSSSLLRQIENGDVKLTYECFGAVGDGKVNDYEAILNTHKFANKEYVDKGIMLTVYGGGADKTYYMGGNNKEYISIITNVDWQKSNFIVDDYDVKNNVNTVNLSKSLFFVTTPLKIASGKSVLEYDISKNNDVLNNDVYKSLNGKINTKTKNLLDFVNAIKNDTLMMKVSDKKFFNDSQVWAINVKDKTMRFIRRGANNVNSGNNQEDIVLINSKTGDVLNEINWDYNDITQIRVWPIPDTNIKIQNGYFTTKTYNIVDKSKTYVQRNIYVAFTGNVDFSNIYHFLDEGAHPYTSSLQTNQYANAYYGFIRLYDAAYVNFNNLYLTPHNYTNNLGTYDLVFDNSSNLLFNNINYACDEYKSDGSKDYNSCYKKKMINPDVWGVMASNSSKNVIIRKSRVNRIDAHRGITNLFIDDSVVGNKGLTLIGKHYLYLRNVKFDRAYTMINFRNDYGSSWEGTVVLNNIESVLDDTTGSAPFVFYSDNAMNHDFGYQSYFPAIYVNGIKFDTSRVTKNINIHLLRLNTNVPNDSLNKYNFYGNVRFANLKITHGKADINLFANAFAKVDSNLKLENYGKTNVVNIGYYDIDQFKLANNKDIENRLKNRNINTKFTFTNSNSTIDTVNKNGIGNAETFFSNLEKTMKMPDPVTNDVAVTSIQLSEGKINEEITPDNLNYTANVSSNVSSISLTILSSGGSRVSYTKTHALKFGSNTINFSVIGTYGVRKKYTLKIVRDTTKLISIREGSNYILGDNYLYTVSDSNEYHILKNISFVDGISLKIQDGYLVVFDYVGQVRILKKYLILHLNDLFPIVGSSIVLQGNDVSVERFLSLNSSNNLRFQLKNTINGTLNDDSSVDVFYDGQLLASYNFSIKSIFADTLHVDYGNRIIYNLLSHYTYKYVVDRIFNGISVKIIDKNGNLVDVNDNVKSYDKVIINYQEKDIEYTVAVLGDANGDGAVSIRDLAPIRNAISSKNYDMIEYYIMDISKDGFVFANDYDLVSRYISGEIKSLR